VDVGQYVRHGPAEPALLRHYAASGEALLGHLHHQLGDPRGALRHYLDGARLLPGDAALNGLVRDAYRDYLRAR
jgi:hypothetical protein